MAEVAEVTSNQQQQEEKPSAPHKLERKWTFWFDKPKQQGGAWGTSLRKVYTFDTVEEFWCLYDQIFRPSKLSANADFHCFKSGIEPKWEDPECANGGKWSITTSRKAMLDTMWLDTIQRTLQLRIEEQGRHLQMMFKKQSKSGIDRLTTPSNPDEQTTKTSNVTQSLAKNELPGKGQDEAEDGPSEGSSMEVVGKKHKLADLEVSNDKEADASEPQSPPSKRPRVQDGDSSSAPSALG